MTTDRTREQWQRSNQRLHRENLELRAEIARLRAALRIIAVEVQGTGSFVERTALAGLATPRAEGE